MKKFLALVLVAGLTGCMGHVVPKPNNQFDAIAKGETADDAMSTALRTAKSTCADRGKQHVVLRHQTDYKGTLSETTYKRLHAMGLWASDDNYLVTMEFSCE